MDEDRTRVPVHFDLSVYETDAVFFFPAESSAQFSQRL